MKFLVAAFVLLCLWQQATGYSNAGLPVGLSIAGVVLLTVLPMVIFALRFCYLLFCDTAASSGSQRTDVVTDTTGPSSGPQVNVVNTNSSNMMQSPVRHSEASAPAYSPNFQPPPPYKM